MNPVRLCVQRLGVLRPQAWKFSPSYSIISRGLQTLTQTANRQTYKFSPVLANRIRSFSSGDADQFEVFNIQDEDDFKKRALDASSNVPVVVQFTATWCGPCKLLGPRLEHLLSKEGGKVKMVKVDIDELSDLAIDYGVKSIPTVIGVKDGKIQRQFVGLIDDDQIKSFIDKLVL